MGDENQASYNVSTGSIINGMHQRYAKQIGMLVHENSELAAIVEQLEMQVAELRSQNAALKG